MRDLSRFIGCLLGGAAGDALGYAVEFSTAHSIFQRFGEQGIRDYVLYRGIAEFSDDTQMTLFTAAGLMHAAKKPGEKTREDYAASIAAAYRDWYRTQAGPYPAKTSETGSPLMEVSGLYSLRAPGNTCMSALRQGGRGSVRCPLNNSKGCGAVMRTAPVGLFFADRPESMEFSDWVAADAGAITHGHPLGWISGAVHAHIVRTLVETGCDVDAAVADAIASLSKTFGETKDVQTQRELLERAAELASSSTPDLEAVRSLGGGWVGEEAIAIAVFCALRYSKDFESCIVAAVNHDGDSDSTGAIAGNILGAALGEDAIPKKYKTDLELRDVVASTAISLHKC